ncbi:MAG: HAD-IC family P-type ATPase, partial [Planctomycetota bacterium]|nr:HAD-IC family P-type ATPase [Planctomycetota bacterium]
LLPPRADHLVDDAVQERDVALEAPARRPSPVAREARLRLAEAVEAQEIGGQGVRAQVEGDTVLVGRRSWVEKCGALAKGLEEPARTEEEGFSTLYVARGQEIIGWIGMVDRTRPEARRATQELGELGVRQLTMVTGDRWGVARRVAAELGCGEVLAECLPEQKLELVSTLRQRGHRVAVVGDGVNDAPALAAGHLGIAMGAAGNDIAIHSASIALMSEDLGRLPFLLRLSRLVRRVVMENLAFGILFVAGGLAAAAMGWLERPAIAAVLHCVGSLIVIFNSARIVRFGEEMSPHGNK